MKDIPLLKDILFCLFMFYVLGTEGQQTKFCLYEFYNSEILYCVRKAGWSHALGYAVLAKHWCVLYFWVWGLGSVMVGLGFRVWV